MAILETHSTYFLRHLAKSIFSVLGLKAMKRIPRKDDFSASSGSSFHESDPITAKILAAHSEELGNSAFYGFYGGVAAGCVVSIGALRNHRLRANPSTKWLLVLGTTMFAYMTMEVARDYKAQQCVDGYRSGTKSLQELQSIVLDAKQNKLYQEYIISTPSANDPFYKYIVHHSNPTIARIFEENYEEISDTAEYGTFFGQFIGLSLPLTRILLSPTAKARFLAKSHMSRIFPIWLFAVSCSCGGYIGGILYKRHQIESNPTAYAKYTYDDGSDGMNGFSDLESGGFNNTGSLSWSDRGGNDSSGSF